MNFEFCMMKLALMDLSEHKIKNVFVMDHTRLIIFLIMSSLTLMFEHYNFLDDTVRRYNNKSKLNRNDIQRF